MIIYIFNKLKYNIPNLLNVYIIFLIDSAHQIMEAFFNGVRNIFYALIFVVLICFVARIFISKESILEKDKY